METTADTTADAAAEAAVGALAGSAMDVLAAKDDAAAVTGGGQRGSGRSGALPPQTSPRIAPTAPLHEALPSAATGRRGDSCRVALQASDAVDTVTLHYKQRCARFSSTEIDCSDSGISIAAAMWRRTGRITSADYVETLTRSSSVRKPISTSLANI